MVDQVIHQSHVKPGIVLGEPHQRPAEHIVVIVEDAEEQTDSQTRTDERGTRQVTGSHGSSRWISEKEPRLFVAAAAAAAEQADRDARGAVASGADAVRHALSEGPAALMAASLGVNGWHCQHADNHEGDPEPND
jgi:hypothetical protein